ncbi:hypothetical protein [Chryseobacterium sp. 2987]|uniref:hypothetical protein n=1 Tax=Chryseobacterium sp. 2987 TaxID=2817767 RepID=UPI0028548262|nr:hypothetical protein [Chryseobacterium sp. 2987]MDR6921415.1 hypothetical protein [Chryseobacterium sp. 2987]
MSDENYYNDFDDFDEESKEILKSSYHNLISPKGFLGKTVQPDKSLQKDNAITLALPQISEAADWQTDEYINLELLVSKIKYANNGMRDYILEYNPKDYKTATRNTSISLSGGNFIRLKAYLNSKTGNVPAKWDQAQITQEIEAGKEKMYYRISFLYEGIPEKSIILETCSYQEFRDLNIILGYGDIDNYKNDYEYFLKNFADALKKHENPEALRFIYENIPETILSNLFVHIDHITFFNHLEILSKADDSDIFRDSSSAMIQIFKAIGDPIPVLKYFRENPDKLNRIYYNLDGSTEHDGRMQSNRMILANIMMLFSLFANNDKRKKEAQTFTIGKGYKINSDILEMGIFQGSNDRYRDTFFLQQQKEVQKRVEIVSKEGDPNATETVTQDLDEGAQFHPLDMVYLIDISGGTEETYLVPAIYLKTLADEKEWAVVHQNIRIAANLVAIVLGVATLATTGNPYFILLAAADMSLAGADLTIQAFKEEIAKIGKDPDNPEAKSEGEIFLENWEKVYLAGGFALAGLTIVGGFYIGAAKLLAKIGDGSARNYLKTLVLKAALETNISNFTKDTIKVAEPKEIFLSSQYRAVGEEMAENGVFFLSGKKEGKFAESYAAVYKGEVIDEFTKAEMHNFYRKWSKLHGGELVEELEHLGGHVPPGNSIVETTIEAEIKAFEKGAEQFSKTIAKPFDHIEEAMPYFNHKSVGDAVKQVSRTNCGNTAEVLVEFLKTGKLRTAKPSGYQNFEEVSPKFGGGSFQPLEAATINGVFQSSFERLKALLNNNDIAVIYGVKKVNSITKSTEGHYFVGIKKDKKLYLFDGQTGEHIVFEPTREFQNFLQSKYNRNYTPAEGGGFKYLKVK